MVPNAGELPPADSLVRSVVAELSVGCRRGSGGRAAAGVSIGWARLIRADRVVVGPANRCRSGAVDRPVRSGSRGAVSRIGDSVAGSCRDAANGGKAGRAGGWGNAGS
jgi:hypothetical protein